MPQILSIAGKTVTELAGSGEITYDPENPGVMRRLLCDWPDAPDICEALLGVANRVGNATMTWRPPMPHPNPKYAYLVGRRARVSGYGVPSQDSYGIISYHKAIIEVEYLKPEAGGGNTEMTFLTERRDLGAEFMTLPRSQLRWAEEDALNSGAGVTALGDDARAGMVLPLTHISIDVHWWFGAITKIRDGTFETLMGTVNDRPIRFLYTNWGAQTLLFNGVQYERQFTTTGQSAFQVTMSFTHKPTRWNRLYRGADGATEDGFWTYCRPSGRRVYIPVDFRNLLPNGYRPPPYWFFTGPIDFTGVTP